MLNILTVALKKLSMKGVSWPCVAGSVTFYEGLQNDSCILNTYQYDIHIQRVDFHIFKLTSTTCK